MDQEKVVGRVRRIYTEQQIQVLYNGLKENSGKAKVEIKSGQVQKRKVRFNPDTGELSVKLFGSKVLVEPDFEGEELKFQLKKRGV